MSIEALPKNKNKNRPSVWTQSEKDTKKRDKKFSQMLQHYELLEGQFNESMQIRETLESELKNLKLVLQQRVYNPLHFVPMPFLIYIAFTFRRMIPLT